MYYDGDVYEIVWFVICGYEKSIKIYQIQYLRAQVNQKSRVEHIQAPFNLNASTLFIISLQLQMSHSEKQEHQKKKRDAGNNRDEGREEEQDQEVYANDSYQSSFVASDDSISEDNFARYRHPDSDDQPRTKKSKKEKKRDKKKKKEKKKRRDQDSFDEDDLDIIDNQDRKLTRLKKKKQAHRQSDQDDQEDDMIEDDNNYAGEYVQSDDDNYEQIQSQSDDLSDIQEIIHQHKDIFDPADMKSMAIEDEYREIVETDLPERYISQLKGLSKNVKKTTLNELRQTLEKQDKMPEAEWIYNKLRTLGFLQTYDERDCRQRIRRILECLHRDHLDIMYIYHYRKKIFSDYLNLDILWKIVELDEEWFTFKEKQKKCLDFLEVILPSFVEVPPELLDFLHQCSQQKYIKYFEDYQQYAQAKWVNSSNDLQMGKNKKKVNKFAFMSQISARGVAQNLDQSEIFLSPQNLFYNLKQKSQQRKPRTPQVEPKDEFQKILRSNSQSDKSKYPLLAPELRFKTISKYLCYQLYCYPELRRLLRQKYYKRLVITTTPTTKGNQDIDLYSVYFPVKRIKEKPVSTLKKQIWILAIQAEQKDLIKIDLKFEWEMSSSQKNQKDSRERDPIYLQIAKNYYDISSHKSVQIWNLFRKRIINGMLSDYFFPSFMKQIKQEMTKEGEKDIINACCLKLKMQLNKGPSLKEGKPIKILSMVLEDTKLGIAFVDEAGKALFTFQIIINNDEELKRFVGDQNLSIYIKQYKPDMILIAANCKRAQTLRKQLRNPEIFRQSSIFSAFGQYEIPRLVAKKKIIQGLIEQESILQALSMARLKKNPMAQIVSLWSERVHENGILSLNLHQYQSYVNQNKLKENLQKVIIEVVNLVGLDLNQVSKNDHIQNTLQFVSGLGPKKAFVFLQKLKQQNFEIINRKTIEQILKGSKIVSKNCSPFLKIETSFHKALFQKIQKQKKGNPIKQYEEINLLDMTRIPQEWYSLILKKISDSYKSTTLSQMRTKRQLAKLSDQNIMLLQIFKNPERIRGIQWKFKDQRDNNIFDEQLVKNQIMNRFKNPRDTEKVMQNRQIFFNLLKETPETLKRYMIMQVKVLSIKKNYLNVIIPQNGLFGYIKLQFNKTPEELQKIYEKGTTIKAVIIGFPFDEKTHRDQAPNEEQQLLKIQMALEFPHKESDRHEGSRHDCMTACFPAIVKEIHPNIDLQKDRFDLRKEDRPVIEVREEKIMTKNIKTDFRRISHPKFKNISAVPAIEMMKSQQIGQFVIRPSSQGPEYLTITWNFFKNVIVHIKVKCQHKGMNSMNITYRIQDKQNRSFNSLQEIIQKCIKPMNVLVQDVTSNKKFMTAPIEQIQNQVKRDMQSDSSHIYYYFGVSEEYPQFILLIYMYRDKKPIKELIKVKSSGLYFHDQQFSNIRDLIVWFKEHLKEKEYQKYVKNATQMIQKMK